MADPGLGIKAFSLLAVAPSGEQGVDLVVNPLPKAFFARPAEQLAPELIGCLLVKRQASGELLWGVIVEAEAYQPNKSSCFLCPVLTWRKLPSLFKRFVWAFLFYQ